MSNVKFLKIGRITKYHGTKGYAKLYYFGNLNDFNYKEVFLKQRGKLLSYFIEDWYVHKNFISIKLKGIGSINDVEKYLKNKEVYVSTTQLPELKEGEFYWYQLYDLEVFDIKGKFIGTIINIIETGSNDVFVVSDNEKETLIPYTDEFVKQIDIKNRKMIVECFEVV